jgi:hypothetical protein
MNFSVSFLNNWDPDFVKISASTKYWFFGCFTYWNSFINNDINPSKVFKDSDDIETNLSEFLENWWVNTFR